MTFSGGQRPSLVHPSPRLNTGAESGHRAVDEPPWSRAPLPKLGVTALGETYPASSEDITPPSSLRRAHAPIPLPLPCFGLAPRWGSLCRLLPAPAANRIFPTLSLRIFPRMLGPLPRRSHRVHLPVSSSVSSAFPNRGMGRLPVLTREYDFSRKRFSRQQTFLNVQASEFAHLPDRSYRCVTAAGQPRFLRPSRTCFVSLRMHRIC